MPGVDGRDPRILASIVLCIGAVTTARALDDHRLAAQILGTSRQLVAALLAAPRT